MNPPPLPRETFEWVGPEAPEERFLAALERRRMPHGWLVSGPAGAGKATFAYRAARRLLGAKPAPAFGRLGAEPADHVSRLVAQGAHPDLLVLQRHSEEDPNRKNIPVEEARTLGEFFAKSPAIAAWRVAIVDAADDLNDHGVNALLKTLEEPPRRAVLLLLCRTPGALAATLRSRCARLAIAPAVGEGVIGWLSRQAGVEAIEARALLALAGGAPGRAWRLADEGGLEADVAARALVQRLPKRDDAALLGLAERFRGAAGAARFALFFERLAAAVRDRAEAALEAYGPGAARAWAEAPAMLSALAREAEAVNLDRADALFTAASRLAAIG